MIKKVITLAEKWFGMEREDIQWFPTIDNDKCTNCETCLKKCSHGVFENINGKVKVVKPFNCVVGCTGCDPLCPEGAISHPSKDYLVNLIKTRNIKNGCGCNCKGD